MDLNLPKFLKSFLVFALSLFILHWLFWRAFAQASSIGFLQLTSIHGFLIALTLIHFLLIKWLFRKWPRQAGFIFMGMSMLKMILAVLFLFPFIYPPNTQSIQLALNFVGIYLLFLSFEVVFLVQNMKKNH